MGSAWRRLSPGGASRKYMRKKAGWKDEGSTLVGSHLFGLVVNKYGGTLMGVLMVKLSLVSKCNHPEFPDIFTRNTRKLSLFLLVIPMSDHPSSPSLSPLALALGQPIAAGRA